MRESGAVSKQNIIAKPQINIINMTNFHRFKTRLRRRARGEPLELKTGGVYVGFLKIQKVSRELFVSLCYFLDKNLFLSGCCKTPFCSSPKRNDWR